MTKVYLAGNMSENWRNLVTGWLTDTNVELLDPLDLGHQPTGHFVAKELELSSTADITFAYISATDTSGVGTMAEVTNAYCHGKVVILVHEGVAPHPFFLYMAHVTRATLESGIKVLHAYLNNDPKYMYVK